MLGCLKAREGLRRIMFEFRVRSRCRNNWKEPGLVVVSAGLRALSGLRLFRRGWEMESCVVVTPEVGWNAGGC